METMDAWRQSAGALVADLEHIFGGRLQSVVAYGPHVEGHTSAPLTCLALVDSLGLSDLEVCAAFAPRWGRQQIATPLILPADEFWRSLDAFPLEYGEIVRAHERLYGSDPFTDTTTSPADLRRACETQIKSHLLHLREGFIEAAGRPESIAALVRASAPAFAALLRSVARLYGGNAMTRADATRDGARAAALPDAVVAEILALEQGAAIPTTDAARVFPGYLAAVEQLARVVDTWTP